MARRISALLGILVLVGFALALAWRVYLHHNNSGINDSEPALVSLHFGPLGLTHACLACRMLMKAGDSNHL